MFWGQSLGAQTSIHDSDPSDFDKDESDVNNDAAFEEGDDKDNNEHMDISEIHNSNFAIIKYTSSCSIKYYIGECVSKDSDTDLTFIFIETEKVYRGNVIHRAALQSNLYKMTTLGTTQKWWSSYKTPL